MYEIEKYISVQDVENYNKEVCLHTTLYRRLNILLPLISNISQLLRLYPIYILDEVFGLLIRKGDEEFQLYLITASDTVEAGKNFNAYRDFLKEYGELDKKQISIGDEAFVGKESWYGVMFFVRKGKYILGSVGLSDLDTAQSHIRKLMSGLP